MFDDNILTNLINAAYRKRWAQLDAVHEGKFVQIAVIDIVADQARYSWPNGMQRMMKLEYVTTDGTQRPLARDERHAASMDPEGGDTESYTYRPLSGGFTLEPTPQSATGSLRIEYVALPDALEADGDTISADFPELFDELIVLDAVVALLASQGQMEDGHMKASFIERQDWEREWKGYINRLLTSRNDIEQWNPHYLDS
jgi:hypothetical protein